VIPLPISDENPTSRRPTMVYLLIAANCLAWAFELFHGVSDSAFDYGAIPSFLLHGTRDGVLQIGMVGRGLVLLHQEVPWPMTLLTSMFMHGSWLHIIGNLWFLWIFGDNVEEAMGSLKFLVFYLACGLLAAGTQVLASPGSQAPMVGASGAIAGVLGSYLVLYPHARVRCLWILFVIVTTIYLPAWLLLGLWFLTQFIMPGEGVAAMAHVGGFIAGLLLVWLFVTRRPPPRRDRFPPLWERVAH
jgi:membrane associated rhomboid family serine protease